MKFKKEKKKTEKKKAEKKSHVVAIQGDGTEIHGFEEKKKRDLSEFSEDIKQHAKFDKFKKGDK